ncbi:MAG: endonuclease/exonuclease/phosphatase family protein [Patescibacteria group bacterium]
MTASTKNLKIATLNFWGGPWPFTIHKRARFKKLINIIKKEKFDVLALQEVFMNSDYKKLASIFKNKYYFYKKKSFILNSSGLVIMSKFPLFNEKYIPLNKQYFLAKGVLQASIKINNRIFEFTNLHLTYCPSYEVCKEEYSRLMSVITSSNSIVMGDFNINFPEFHLPKGYKFLSDPANITLEIKNHYSTAGSNKMHQPELTIDFIISNANLKVISTKTDNQNIVSDHYLVSSTIALE